MISSCQQSENADLLIHNASIYTVNNAFDIEEAMAIKDGKIIAIGPNNELKNKYTARQIIDAKLKPIYPGFIDAHCHFLPYGNTFFEVDLVGTKSWEEVIEKLSDFAKANETEWITGRGWDQNDWELKEFPTNEKLNELFPDKAILLKRIDGHAAIANQKALELSGVDIETSIEGGVFEIKDGELSGLLIDNAVDIVQKAIPEQSEAQIKKSLLKAEEMCFAKGLTTLSDAMLENEVANCIIKMHSDNSLKMKVYGMLMPTKENKEQFLKNGPFVTDKLSIRSFKFFADGALGSRGAKLKEPYADDIHNNGLYLSDSSTLSKEAKNMYEAGFQMNTHCIGDAANELMLKIYADYLKEPNDKRWRIEHCQVVDPTDLAYFKDYTIIPSVQPTHATSDMYWAEERLGERVKGAYAYADLLAQNGLIALGTDFPIEDIDPLKTFFAACIRKDDRLFPEEGFQSENKLSKEEALRGMTIWAAIANFEEEKKGSLEIGKDADFVIFNQDIMAVPEEQILNSKVEMTFINGEMVFEKSN